MKIHLISDVHAEQHPRLQLSAPANADLIVMAGDIHSDADSIEWAENCYGENIPIVLVAGNHEFYYGDLTRTKDLIERATAGTNIHFLENKAVVIDGVRFIGCTLWTSFNEWADPDNINYLRNMINDHNYIKCESFYADPELRAQAALIDPEYMKPESVRRGFITPVITYLLHKQSVEFLEAELAKPFAGKTVVVTHHAPSYRSINSNKEEYRDAYASNLEPLITKYAANIDVWFHGHLHVPADYSIAGVPIRSNPRDYPSLTPNSGVEEFIYVLR